MSYVKRFMLLGSGELGREFVIAVKRMGYYIVAIGRYPNAPAMQISDDSEVIDMLDPKQLETVVNKYKPDYIIPEIEAINTEKLFDFEKSGITVVPSAKAVKLCMDRKGLRELATKLNIKTSKYEFAKGENELQESADRIGYPCVVKPLMSSSGKGQTIVRSKEELHKAWTNLSNGRGNNTMSTISTTSTSSDTNKTEMIVEEFIDFDFEVTLLTVSTRTGVYFCLPIRHIQHNGDYQESWFYENVTINVAQQLTTIAKTMVNSLEGFGLWGAEFFVKGDDVYFSEISPRPHDTGMVTLANVQHLNQFQLHAYAALNLNLSGLVTDEPKDFFKWQEENAVSRAICSNGNDEVLPSFENLQRALLKFPEADIRLFSKPEVYPGRRIGIILMKGSHIDQLRQSTKSVLNILQSRD